MKISLSTKILPEATTWHFAKDWTHMKELKLDKKPKSYLRRSQKILERAVSIPINCHMQNDLPLKIKNALRKVIK